MPETLTMSHRERDRLKAFERIKAKTLTRAQAAESLSLSERHVYRLYAKFLQNGDAALVHGLRGRKSNRGYSGEIRAQAVNLFKRYYCDYGPSLFAEVLAELHGISVGHETLRRWLSVEALWNGQRKKRPHRSHRARRETIGDLVQFDGSPHDWFEGRGPTCTLLLAVDDASGWSYARLATSENTEEVLRTLRGYVERHGLPCALYTDHGSVYGEESAPTDVARAMEDLDVKIIRANSPQAKGRVERYNGVHQDRLIKAMRRANICSIAEANVFLEHDYLPKHNTRFANKEGLVDVHRSVGDRNLDLIFCMRTQRKVANDYTIQLNGAFIQLLKSDAPLPPPKCSVVLRWLLDNTLHIYWKDNELAFKHISKRPLKKPSTPRLLPQSHSWRKKSWGKQRQDILNKRRRALTLQKSLP